jgi:hypothetical protein
MATKEAQRGPSLRYHIHALISRHREDCKRSLDLRITKSECVFGTSRGRSRGKAPPQQIGHMQGGDLQLLVHKSNHRSRWKPGMSFAMHLLSRIRSSIRRDEGSKAVRIVRIFRRNFTRRTPEITCRNVPYCALLEV